MANHKSAIKRHKQSLKAQARNKATKTRIKNACKLVNEAIEANDKAQAEIALKSASSILDKAAGKKVIHWKKAARKISRLAQAANKI